MYIPYDVHRLSRLYREAALKEARVRHLEQRARASCRSRSEEQHGRWPWLSTLAAAAFGST